jgi:peptidoglycan/xylan/chitin deacetylase (PgdA/CDA1 family)
MFKTGVIALALAVAAGAFFFSRGISLAESTGDLDERARVLEDQLDELAARRDRLTEQLRVIEDERGDLDVSVRELRQRLKEDREEIDLLSHEVARLLAEIEELRDSQSGTPPPPIFRDGSGVVTLTFDDSSPAPRAHEILDILRRYNVRAVFCVNGNWARENPDVIARMVREGHKLCNHTASHAWLTRLSDEEIRREIEGGLSSDILRPPYGAYDARVSSIAASLGYQLYLWSIDTRDWTGVPADTIVNTVMSELHAGAVVLMHLHGAGTLEALPQIIEGVQARGYTLGLD